MVGLKGLFCKRVRMHAANRNHEARTGWQEGRKNKLHVTDEWLQCVTVGRVVSARRVRARQQPCRGWRFRFPSEHVVYQQHQQLYTLYSGRVEGRELNVCADLQFWPLQKECKKWKSQEITRTFFNFSNVVWMRLHAGCFLRSREHPILLMVWFNITMRIGRWRASSRFPGRLFQPEDVVTGDAVLLCSWDL